MTEVVTYLAPGPSCEWCGTHPCDCVTDGPAFANPCVDIEFADLKCQFPGCGAESTHGCHAFVEGQLVNIYLCAEHKDSAFKVDQGGFSVEGSSE